MAGIQLSGLASGLDTQSLITQLMAVERQPRTKITMQQAAVTKRQSLLQDLSSKLDALKQANNDLKSIGTWLDTQSVTSGDTGKVDVRKTAGAPPGTYDVAVTQMATAERVTYDFPTALAADTDLDVLDADGITSRGKISLKAGATVDDAVSAINSSTTAGVYAVNVNGDLVLSAKKTGASSGFSVTNAGGELDRVSGLNAIFTIDNQAQPASETNVIANALPGVEFTLKGKTTTPVAVTVGTPGPDKDAIVTKVKAFTDAYNAVVSLARLDLEDKPDPKAATSTDAQRGTLFGDTTLRNLLSAMRITTGDKVDGMTGTTDFKYLSDIGVSTGAAKSGSSINNDAVDGKLTVDTTKLRDALDDNPLAVRKLLGGLTGTPGFSGAFDKVVGAYAGTSGIFKNRIDEAGKELGRIADNLTTFDARMDMKEARYQKQFTALEQALADSQAQGNRLSGFLTQSSSG